MLKKYSIFFFYISLLLGTFFLFQTYFLLTTNFESWGLPQYALLTLIFLYLILCSLKFYSYQKLLKTADYQTMIQESNKKRLLEMTPHHLEELFEDLFQTTGASKVHATPHMNQPFYDIEMNSEEGNVLISCLFKEQNQTIPKSYLDRLYLLMKNNEVEQGAFITIGDFSNECYEFTKDKPIHLINGDDLLDSINL